MTREPTELVNPVSVLLEVALKIFTWLPPVARSAPSGIGVIVAYVPSPIVTMAFYWASVSYLIGICSLSWLNG